MSFCPISKVKFQVSPFYDCHHTGTAQVNIFCSDIVKLIIFLLLNDNRHNFICI